jgi:hypothetical protein
MSASKTKTFGPKRVVFAVETGPAVATGIMAQRPTAVASAIHDARFSLLIMVQFPGVYALLIGIGFQRLQ